MGGGCKRHCESALVQFKQFQTAKHRPNRPRPAGRVNTHFFGPTPTIRGGRSPPTQRNWSRPLQAAASATVKVHYYSSSNFRLPNIDPTARAQLGAGGWVYVWQSE